MWVRHGATALSHEKRFSGSGTDPGIDEVGRAQLSALEPVLARVLADSAPDRIYVSPLRRTRESAAVLLGEDHPAPEVAPELREMDFGSWEGLTFAEVLAADPEGVARWQASAEQPTGGGESMASVGERVLGWLTRTLEYAEPGETWLLVSHVTPIKCAVTAALGAPWTALYRMELAPASLTEIAYRRSEASWVGSLRTFNLTG